MEVWVWSEVIVVSWVNWVYCCGIEYGWSRCCFIVWGGLGFIKEIVIIWWFVFGYVVFD